MLEKNTGFVYERVVDGICGLNWDQLTRDDLVNVAWAYYFFSVQFRENLEVARSLYPDDDGLLALDHGERDTDNLSPHPGVAAPGEKMNHDEFMRRALGLETIAEDRRQRLETLGRTYLDTIRPMNRMTRALSIASYEDGGLENVFTAILDAPKWNGPLLQAFRHFLIEHIRFDSDPEAGHGALCRRLIPNDTILPLWTEFERILVEAAPRLAAKRS